MAVARVGRFPVVDLVVAAMPEGGRHVGQLLVAVAEVAHADDGHLVEGQDGPLPQAPQDDGVQLRVVLLQGAVDLQPQQVGGEADLPDGRRELARLWGQNLGGLRRPQHLPPGGGRPGGRGVERARGAGQARRGFVDGPWVAWSWVMRVVMNAWLVTVGARGQWGRGRVGLGRSNAFHVF